MRHRKTYTMGESLKRGSQNQKKHTPIPLLGLQMAIFNTFPSRQHKTALADMRANIAERLYRISQPSTRERL